MFAQVVLVGLQKILLDIVWKWGTSFSSVGPRAFGMDKTSCETRFDHRASALFSQHMKAFFLCFVYLSEDMYVLAAGMIETLERGIGWPSWPSSRHRLLYSVMCLFFVGFLGMNIVTRLLQLDLLRTYCYLYRGIPSVVSISTFLLFHRRMLKDELKVCHARREAGVAGSQGVSDDYDI